MTKQKRYRKPSRYRSPDEKRIRKEIRALIRSWRLQELDDDALVRSIWEMVDDEKRRAYSSMPIEVSWSSRFPTSQKALIQSLSSF